MWPRTQLSSTRVWSAPRCATTDRKSTRLNSSHGYISYAVFCLNKERQAGLARENFLPCLRRRITQRRDVGTSFQLVIVDRDLGVQRLHTAFTGCDEGIDLSERGSDRVDRGVESLHDVGGGACLLYIAI